MVMLYCMGHLAFAPTHRPASFWGETPYPYLDYPCYEAGREIRQNVVADHARLDAAIERLRNIQVSQDQEEFKGAVIDSMVLMRQELRALAPPAWQRVFSRRRTQAPPEEVAEAVDRVPTGNNFWSQMGRWLISH